MLLDCWTKMESGAGGDNSDRAVRNSSPSFEGSLPAAGTRHLQCIARIRSKAGRSSATEWRAISASGRSENGRINTGIYGGPGWT